MEDAVHPVILGDVWEVMDGPTRVLTFSVVLHGERPGCEHVSLSYILDRALEMHQQGNFPEPYYSAYVSQIEQLMDHSQDVTKCIKCGSIYPADALSPGFACIICMETSLGI